MQMQSRVYVWDLFVRLFHWSLVLAFAVAYLSGEDGSGLHVYAGYVICALVALRVIWGFVGSRYARFSEFIRPPGEAVAYLRELAVPRSGTKVYLGHNPAGGWMTVALLLSLAATCYTGLELYGAEGHGPLAQNEALLQPAAPAYPPGLLVSRAVADPDEDQGHGRKARDRDHVDSEAEEFWEEIHEFFANFTLFLIVVHVAGVIASSYRHRVSLIGAMISGYKSSGPRP